jgi:CHAT domain-containing protein
MEGIIVLADPIFSRADERVMKSDSKAALAEAPVKLNESQLFGRVRSTAREAEMIGSLFPSTRIRSGYAASVKTVLGGELSDYRIVHFATHAATSPNNPDEMGLIFSQYDEQLNPSDGFLSLPEILGLKLSADLVVLSACETGISRGAVGNWMGSLSSAFISAGARQVIASLWTIQGRATTELMKRFYSILSVGNISAAAALCQAQAEMWRDGRYAPAEYFGFAAYGEWRKAVGNGLESGTSLIHRIP